MARSRPCIKAGRIISSQSAYIDSPVHSRLLELADAKEVLLAWQKRKQEEIQHPFIGGRVPFGLVPHCHGLLLAGHLRGDLDVS